MCICRSDIVCLCESILRWHLNKTYNYAYHNCSTVLITLFYILHLLLSLVFLFEIRRIRFSYWFCWHSVLDWKRIKRLCQSFFFVGGYLRAMRKKSRNNIFLFHFVYICIYDQMGKKTKNYSHRSPVLNRKTMMTPSIIYISLSLLLFLFSIVTWKKSDVCEYFSREHNKKWRRN
jgi:hypothetical protein